MRVARDIMEPIIDSVSPEISVREAIMRMRVATRKPGIYGVKGILVLDAEGKLVGMLTVRDILRGIMPPYMERTEIGAFSWPGMLESMARRIGAKTVGEIMSTELKTVRTETSLMECAALITKHNLWRLPVVDDDNRPLGMVYVRDLHYAIVDAIFGAEEL